MSNFPTETAEMADVEVLELDNRKVEYRRDVYGFLKQQNPQKFYYSENYQQKQQTTSEMVELRMGWLNLHLQNLKNMNVVEMGSGSGIFIREASKNFRRLVPYNLVEPTISKDELYCTTWDLCCAFDVIEHMEDIDKELFGVRAKYYYLSYPEYHDTPLKSWRHTKPDEHLWHLNIEGMRKFIDGKAEIIAEGCPEDLIRKRWDPNLNNITSVLLKRL
jgi:hypothetical protein